MLRGLSPQYSLKFLVPDKCVGYDLSRPPGLRNPGGGIGVKYARVEEASDFHLCQRASSLDEIEADDIVFADWLWFLPDKKGETHVDKVKAFVSLPNLKGIYGSELSVLTWESQLLKQLIAGTHIITHNTDYQRNLYGILGIYTSRFLCDPIPESVFSPLSQGRERRLVFMGQISLAKRSNAVIEIFNALKGSGVERCYMGGRTMWGDYAPTKIESKLHDEIESASDIFMENATQAEVAAVVNGSSFYGHVSHHDVASSACQENMMSGSVVFGLSHPVLQERTPHRFREPLELANAVRGYELDSPQHTADIDNALQVASQWSYQAWNQQLEAILRSVT